MHEFGAVGTYKNLEWNPSKEQLASYQDREVQLARNNLPFIASTCRRPSRTVGEPLTVKQIAEAGLHSEATIARLMVTIDARLT